MKHPRILSRRTFLRWSAPAALSWFWYACSPAAPPTPEPTRPTGPPPGRPPTRPPATRPGVTSTIVPTQPPPTAVALATATRLPATPLGEAGGGLADALLYYLGYATEDDMRWVEEFDVDVLTRGFLLFLNSSDAWIPAYQPRMQQCQDDGRHFLVALQAAVLVEDALGLPRLGGDDPALAFPMDSIPQWRDYACRTPEGQTLGEAKGATFAHSCINNAQFQQFFKGKLQMLIDSGADGVHIDELPTRYFASHEGYCDACTEGMRDYLTRKYPADQLQSRYGIDDPGSFDFRERLADEGQLQNAPENPLHTEWWLYQLSNLARVECELLAFCKSHAGSQGRQFLFNSNAYEPESNPQHVIEMVFEDLVTIGTGLTIDIRKDGQLSRPHRFPPHYSYVPLYRLAKAIAPRKPVTLFIDGPGGTGVIGALTEQRQKDIVRWMFAEAYASGASFHVPYPSLDYYGPLEACQAYARFIRERGAAYRGATQLAEVGVLFSWASEIWDAWAKPSSREPNHNRQWYGLCQALTDMSIQYEVVFAPDGRILQDGLKLQDLQHYPVVIVPWAYSLSEAHAMLLIDYARSGGTLVLVGQVAYEDEERNARPDSTVDRFQAAGAIRAQNPDLEAYLNDPQSQAAAAVRAEVTSWVAQQMVSVHNERVTAQLTRVGNTLYVHLINKDLRESGFAVQRGIDVRISLPEDLELAGDEAVYRSPDSGGGEERLPIVASDSTVEVTVPSLEVYGVLELRVLAR